METKLSFFIAHHKCRLQRYDFFPKNCPKNLQTQKKALPSPHKFAGNQRNIVKHFTMYGTKSNKSTADNRLSLRNSRTEVAVSPPLVSGNQQVT
jgi:hypothetical protein